MRKLCSQTYAKNRLVEHSAPQDTAEDTAEMVLEQDEQAAEELAKKKQLAKFSLGTVSERSDWVRIPKMPGASSERNWSQGFIFLP